MALLQDKRIFIIEDNTENRVLTRLALAQHGARLEFEMWGRDTVQRLKAFAPIDIVLLDLMLPGGTSGYAVFEKIRAEAAFANVPVVAVSASDPLSAIPRCQKLGFSGYIAKPIDVELFPQQVAKAIDHQPVWYTGMTYLQNRADPK